MDGLFQLNTTKVEAGHASDAFRSMYEKLAADVFAKPFPGAAPLTWFDLLNLPVIPFPREVVVLRWVKERKRVTKFHVLRAIDRPVRMFEMECGAIATDDQVDEGDLFRASRGSYLPPGWNGLCGLCRHSVDRALMASNITMLLKPDVLSRPWKMQASSYHLADI